MCVPDDLWKFWPQRAFPCEDCPSTRSGNLRSRSGPGRTCQVFTSAPRPSSHQPHPRATDRHAHTHAHSPLHFKSHRGNAHAPPEDGWTHFPNNISKVTGGTLMPPGDGSTHFPNYISKVPTPRRHVEPRAINESRSGSGP